MSTHDHLVLTTPRHGLLWRAIDEVRREQPEATWVERDREIQRRMEKFTKGPTK